MRTSNSNQKKKEKSFGYFPFKELPPVMTQVVEEVIECEIGKPKHPTHRPCRNKYGHSPPTKRRQTS